MRKFTFHVRKRRDARVIEQLYTYAQYFINSVASFSLSRSLPLCSEASSVSSSMYRTHKVCVALIGWVLQRFLHYEKLRRRARADRPGARREEGRERRRSCYYQRVLIFTIISPSTAPIRIVRNVTGCYQLLLQPWRSLRYNCLMYYCPCLFTWIHQWSDFYYILDKRSSPWRSRTKIYFSIGIWLHLKEGNYFSVILFTETANVIKCSFFFSFCFNKTQNVRNWSY